MKRLKRFELKVNLAVSRLVVASNLKFPVVFQIKVSAGSVIIINLKLMHKKAKKGVGQSKNFGKSRPLTQPLRPLPSCMAAGRYCWDPRAHHLWLNLNLAYLYCV